MGSMAGYLSSFPENTKTVSSFKKVFELTTDANSLKSSKEFIENLESLINKLPKEKNEVNLLDLNQQLEVTKENQLSINQMFHTIDYLFEKEQDNPVVIDDDNILKFLSNMKKAQEYLSYIYDYITLVLKVNTPVEKKAYTCLDFTNLLKN